MRPDWNDKGALISYVVQAIADLGSGGPALTEKAEGPADTAAIIQLAERRDQERKNILAKYGLTKSPFGPHPEYSTSTWEELERELVAMAESGNYARLFHFLKIPAARTAFQESTWRLISDIGTGQHKRPKHRPPETEAQRFNQNRLRKADYLFPVVLHLLRAWYPKQKGRAIRERAIEILANIELVRESKLIDHQRLSSRDPRRR